MHPATQTERQTGAVSIAILGADTILAALPATPVQLAHACQQAGYDLVVPGSWGDELIAAECLHQLGDRGPRPAVMCACPLVRDELLAVGPDLAPMLVPLVPPPVAVARYLRRLYGEDRVHLTYVGACPGGADPAINVRSAPADFLPALAAEGISLTDQPRVFDSVIPPDRRRFFSLAGGVPSAEQLWSAGNGRSLVELDGDDYLIDLAQHLLSHECTLIDLAPRLGCACSGASATIPARSARAAVAVIEPPRASSSVMDASVGLELSSPIPFDAAPRSTLADEETPSPASVVAGEAVTPVRSTESVEPSTPPYAVAAPMTMPPRRRSPAAGIRSIQGSVPIARVAGRHLPRAYVAARKPTPPNALPEPIAPDVARIPSVIPPEAAGDENGRARVTTRVAAARLPGQAAPAAIVAAGAAGAPERMTDGPRS